MTHLDNQLDAVPHESNRPVKGFPSTMEVPFHAAW